MDEDVSNEDNRWLIPLGISTFRIVNKQSLMMKTNDNIRWPSKHNIDG